MFSVPLAVIGVVLMLLVTGTAFNMQAGIGALMLGGIVVNNAILLVDQTNLLRRRGDGVPLRQAVRAGRPPPPAADPDDRPDHDGRAPASPWPSGSAKAGRCRHPWPAP